MSRLTAEQAWAMLLIHYCEDASARRITEMTTDDTKSKLLHTWSTDCTCCQVYFANVSVILSNVACTSLFKVLLETSKRAFLTASKNLLLVTT